MTTNRESFEAQVNKDTVTTYSERGSRAYEDRKNREFLYGKITVDFLRGIDFSGGDRVVLDIGCGTGLGFEILAGEFERRGMQGTGIDPAQGMLDLAVDKFRGNGRFTWKVGSFERIPLADKSVDKIISTLALHWVTSLPLSAAEMERVLKDNGSLDILMIAKDDGYHFKKAIVKALRRHLTFAQVMKTAGLAIRVSPEELRDQFAVFHQKFDIDVKKVSDVVFGSFEDHMKWWKARSSQVICDVKDRESFMKDLREELEKTRTERGIPFDSNLLHIKVWGKSR
ncbi:class I SAM-dependent methyltransferase [bacterium]|nr:class I SAM-dependent methyltransferase [bacterium]